MNEQDIINKKIEKREKTDIFLGYLLILILLACISYVVYIKFFSNSITANQEEHTSDYITLEAITTSLNSSILNNELKINSTVSNNIITIKYQKETEEKNLTVPLINNELEVTINEEDKEEITKIYKEITTAICKYYNKDKEEECTSQVENLSNESVEGIRFVTNENNTIAYINIMKSIDLSNNEGIVQTPLALQDISKENKTNIQLDNIAITSTSADVRVKYNVSYKDTNTKKDFKLTISLYDEKEKLLEEKIREYAMQDIPSILEDEEVFILSETLKLETIKKYSITITE